MIYGLLFLVCVTFFPTAMFGVQTIQSHLRRQSSGSSLLHEVLKLPVTGEITVTCFSLLPRH